LKNYLLYFFVVLMWMALVPFAPVIIGDGAKAETYENSHIIRVLTIDNTVVEMTLDDYVLGVMLSEMPASYEKQALLAQAVVIRSYTQYLLEAQEQGDEHHTASGGLEYDLCSNPSCCRKYTTESELVSLAGKTNAEARIKAMSAAVSETSGEVLTYNGKTAMTLYHASSPARTESYESLFGTAVPYLVGIDNVDESSFIHYKKETYFTFLDLQVLLAANGYEYKHVENEVFSVTLNENLRANNIVIGSTDIPATDFIKIIGLKSCCIEITTDGAGYLFKSSGYGSGLGMSQYGASLLAMQGYSYKDILKFYFKDTSLEKR